MPQYRGYSVSDDRHFTGREQTVCVDDGEAVGKTGRRTKRYAIAFWNGLKLVDRPSGSQAEAMAQIDEGCLASK